MCQNRAIATGSLDSLEWQHPLAIARGTDTGTAGRSPIPHEDPDPKAIHKTELAVTMIIGIVLDSLKNMIVEAK